MNNIELRKTLESESGQLNWQEIEKHFARGAVRVVAEGMDLIETAIDIAQNNTDKISEALASNSISEPTNKQAIYWQQHNSNFLSVVVAPFVLIQQIKKEA